MAIPTTEKLAKAMEEVGCPSGMIQRALEGEFDDFKSNSATPIVRLVRELQSIGQNALAQRAMDGEFDATKEEADAWYAEEGHKLLE